MDNDRQLADLGIWPLIAAIAAGSALWMCVAGLRLEWTGALMPALTCIGLEILAACYRHLRPDVRLATTLTAVAQLVAFSAVAASLSYAVASTGGPLWDGTLFSWDLALGLDWRAYLAFVNAHPRIGLVFDVAYQSLLPQMIVILMVLGLSGRTQALRDFLLAIALAGLATILISALMPAMAMFVHLGLRPEDFPQLAPAAAYVHVAAMTGLRDGTMHVFSLRNAEGIITFPSFHAALGSIFVLALWPHRRLRWPAVVLNGILLAATPIDGGHYFVDVFAGVAIASGTTALARWYGRTTPVRLVQAVTA